MKTFNKVNKVLILGNSELVVFGFRRELVEALIADGADVTACFPQSEFGDGYTTAKELGCSYLPIDMSWHGTNFLNDLKYKSEIEKIILNIKPDVIFTYTIKPNIYGAMIARKYNIPCILTISGLGTAMGNKGILQYITTNMFRFATNKVQAIFFQNQENIDYFLKNRIPMQKYCLVSGSGVNIDKFKLLPYPNQDKIHFLYIGRVIKEKGIEEYFETARIIGKKYSNIVFHVIGNCSDQKYIQTMQTMENDGDYFVYDGYQKDIKPFLEKCSCIIHPTNYPEGMSNVLLESLATGRPIIATDVIGCNDIIEDNVNGFVCKIGDSNDLIQKVDKFVNLTFEQKQNMGILGRKKVEQKFNRTKVVQAYIDEYRIACNDNISVATKLCVEAT